MLLCGIAGGLLFDFFRAIRKVVSMNGLWVGICDLLFWLLCTAAVFFSARLTNQGELRWYEFIGVFLGIALYFLLFGSVVVQGMAALLRAAVKAVLFLFRLLLIPVRLLRRPVLFLGKKAAPLRKRILFGWSVWKQKCLFSRKQLKKILKTPKIFLFWY